MYQVLVTIYNWFPIPLVGSPQVIVLVEKSQQYEFVLEDQGDITMANARRVIIESQGEASMLFPIMPLELGEIEISVHARSANSSDDIVRTVLVKVQLQTLTQVGPSCFFNGTQGKGLMLPFPPLAM